VVAELICSEGSNMLETKFAVSGKLIIECFANGSGCPKKPSQTPYCFNKACWRDSKRKSKTERFA